MSKQTCNQCGEIFDAEGVSEQYKDLIQEVDQDPAYEFASDGEEAIYLGVYCLACADKVFVDDYGGVN